MRPASWMAVLVFASVVLPARPGWPGSAGELSIEVFAGSASKPATEEAARRFERQTAARVVLHFGGSGSLLSQMALARRGDVYLPGSSDFMERAKREGLVDPATEVRVAYLIPAIGVARGNPKDIRRIEDLGRPGLRVGMARPETVCLGLYGVEVLDGAGLSDSVRPNVVNYAESCERTAQMLALGLVDAVLGWGVFERWDPEHIETVALAPQRVPRIGYIPAALSVFSRQPALARAFLLFLSGPEGRAVFDRHGYLTELSRARAAAGRDTPLGGEFILPPGWR